MSIELKLNKLSSVEVSNNDNIKRYLRRFKLNELSRVKASNNDNIKQYLRRFKLNGLFGL